MCACMYVYMYVCLHVCVCASLEHATVMESLEALSEGDFTQGNRLEGGWLWLTVVDLPALIHEGAKVGDGHQSR